MVLGHKDPERLAAVRRYQILDAPGDGTFDRVARLAADVFGTPIATVSIVDADRVWFAACQGLPGVAEVGPEPGLCTSVVVQDDTYVVNDAAIDPRTLDHPLVRGELGLRFYAAAPIITADGHRLGTVNVIDRQPREVTDAQTEMLSTLAGLVADHLELRLAAIQAVRAEKGLADVPIQHQPASARLAEQLRAAAGTTLAAPHECQLGGTPPCTEPAELKVADPWGDSAWGCILHAEQVIVTLKSTFIADPTQSNLADYLQQSGHNRPVHRHPK